MVQLRVFGFSDGAKVIRTQCSREQESPAARQRQRPSAPTQLHNHGGKPPMPFNRTAPIRPLFFSLGGCYSLNYMRQSTHNYKTVLMLDNFAQV